jgi:hypothetical protein
LDLFGLSRSPSLIFGSFFGPLSFRRLTLSPGLALIEATKRSGYKTRLSRFFALRLRCRSLLCLPLGCLATPLFLHRRFAGLEFRPASLGGLSLEVVLVCLDQPLGDRLLGWYPPLTARNRTSVTVGEAHGRLVKVMSMSQVVSD